MRLGCIFKTLTILGLSTAVFGSAGWFGYQLIVKPQQAPPGELAAGKSAPPPDPSLPDFEKTMKVASGRDLVKTRDALERFIENYPFSTKLDETRKALGKVNSDIFFSTVDSPDKVRYEIRSGDALGKIERKLKTTGELIMRCNNLDDPRRLRIGQVLLVTPADFSVTVDRKTRVVTLFNQGKFFREYAAQSWNVPAPKKGTEKQPIAAKVTRKMAWRDGNPVNFPAKEYMGSDRWVETSAKGYAFFTEGGQKPVYGIGIAPDEMEEISTLLKQGVPVNIK